MPIRFLLLIILSLCALLPSKAFALDVESVRFGIYQDKTRLVLDLNQPAEYRAFVLPDPYRMVIDLPSFTWNAGKVGGPESAGVLATRQGNLQPGISRIVFDMNRPVSIQNSFTLPAENGNPNRIVIDFANVSPSVFDQVKHKTHGSLDVDKPNKPKAYTQTPPPPTAPKPPPKNEKPLIIIDAGHGGVDPGAIGRNGSYEKDVVLKLAKALKSELESTGRYRIKLTRENDTFIKLSNRVKFARNHDGDLFISIHADSLDDKTVGGASVYTLSEKASDAQTARLAARENKADLIAGIDLSTEDEQVVNILMDLARRDTMNQSKFFAGKLVGTLPQNGVKTLKSAHRYAGFAVLKAPDIPSVLVEAGFMSNAGEEKRLNTAEFRKKFSRAMRNGIDAYFEQVRKNQRL